MLELDEVASLHNTRERYERVVGGLDKDFSRLRGGRPSPSMFDHIEGNAYGQNVPLSSVAQATMKGANQVVLASYDPGLAATIAKAIRDAGMSLNPQVEKAKVIVVVPKPSKEAREKVAKIASKQAEKAKVHLRGIRHKVMDSLKEHKDSFSEDDVHRRSKEIDTLTHEYEAKLSKALEKKKKDVMEL